MKWVYRAVPGGALRRLARDRWHRLCGSPHRSDAGMSTAEYAVGTIAAAAFAAVLYKIVTSDAVSSALQRLIERALNGAF